MFGNANSVPIRTFFRSCDSAHGALTIRLPDPNMRLLFARVSAEKIQIYGLVLSAVGIDHQVSRQGLWWYLAVRTSQRAAAVEAISLYLKENPPQSIQKQTVFSMGARTHSAWYVAAILALVHLLIALGREQQPFVAAFGADASKIMAGELYRCVTALLLHADGQHLLGNLAGLILFGTVAASLC